MDHRLVTFTHKFNFIGILLNIKNITAEDNYCAGNRELHVTCTIELRIYILSFT